MPGAELSPSRLDAYSLDEAGVAEPFSARLARENDWSVPYAERVIQEYKRFVLLAAGAGHPVTPSDAVDQAWHLHITYTRSYARFCKEVLGRFLHHEPSRGGSAECRTFRAQYEMTLEAYRRTFGERAPGDIWPNVQQRFGEDQRFVRVSPRAAFIISKRASLKALQRGAALAVVLAIALPQLLALRGPDFLTLLVALTLLGFGAAWFTRERHYRGPTEPIALDPYEAAYLQGREPSVASAALAELMASGVLTLLPDNTTVRAQKPLPESAHAVERAAYERAQPNEPASTPATLPLVYAAAAAAARDVGTRLRGLGLIGRSPRLPLAVALAAPALGATKLVFGLSAGQPVAFLAILVLASVVIAVSAFAPKTVTTPRGRSALERLRSEHAELRVPGPASAALPGGTVALAVGLFGLSVLPELPLGQFAQVLGATQQHALRLNAGACGGDGADGGDGGGCGGCGCGGCGGCGCG